MINSAMINPVTTVVLQEKIATGSRLSNMIPPVSFAGLEDDLPESKNILIQTNTNSIGSDLIKTTVIEEMKIPSTSKTEQNLDNKISSEVLPSSPVLSNSCYSEGHSTCSAEGQDIFYVCSGEKWIYSTCSSGTICKMVSSIKAVCIDPKILLLSNNTENASKEPCELKGQTKCSAADKGAYLKCDSEYWQVERCSGDDVCSIDKNANAICISKNDKKVEAEPCIKNGESRCSASSKKLYQQCVDNKWDSFSCDGLNECGIKNSSAICYNPKESIENIILESCDNKTPLRCYDKIPNMFQKCINNYWTNMNCSGNSVCEKIFENNTIGCFDPAVKNRNTNGTIIVPETAQLGAAISVNRPKIFLYFVSLGFLLI
ncbi:hypothetical protein BB561_004752 [Smittium simulii]|uniref:Carbohydrate-binding module family 19 domain-containing protein n=1 Tax=Smittium simulii TaxID=133385 RepID=A0A2T9YEI4_9FUNG|nr:hypothetical protein BB561_004752 [Smittium simulii]